MDLCFSILFFLAVSVYISRESSTFYTYLQVSSSRELQTSLTGLEASPTAIVTLLGLRILN